MNDKTLIYVKAGYATARVDWSYASPAAPGDIMRSHEDYDGLRLGVGGERRLTDNLSATAEP